MATEPEDVEYLTWFAAQVTAATPRINTEVQALATCISRMDGAAVKKLQLSDLAPVMAALRKRQPPARYKVAHEALLTCCEAFDKLRAEQWHVSEGLGAVSRVLALVDQITQANAHIGDGMEVGNG